MLTRLALIFLSVSVAVAIWLGGGFGVEGAEQATSTGSSAPPPSAPPTPPRRVAPTGILADFPPLRGKVRLARGLFNGYISPSDGERLELDFRALNLDKFEFDTKAASYNPLPGPLEVAHVHWFANGTFESMRLVSRDDHGHRLTIDIVPYHNPDDRKAHVWILEESRVIRSVAYIECTYDGPLPSKAEKNDAAAASE